jgi:hypothetical protein
MKRAMLGLMSVISLTACGTAAEPASSTEPSRFDPHATGAQEVEGVVHGYRHDVSRATFPLLGNLVEKQENGFRKVLSSDGVFAVDLANGASYAIANAGAPFARLPPFTHDPAVHNARVLSYFVGAGLPKDQVGGVHVTTLMRAHGAAGETDAQPELVGYTSVVTRAIDGIGVPESHAWARLNVNGDVVSESVYWPDIPTRVVTEAKASLPLFKDEAALHALRARLRAGEGEVQLAIHHAAAGLSSVTPDASAVIDVTSRDRGASTTRHFRSNGDELFLAHEQRVSASPADGR